MVDDREIAKKVKIKPIEGIAKKLGIEAIDLEKYGMYKAKVSPEAVMKGEGKKGKLIMVTAMTPTPAGEGKTTTSIGLADALSGLGKKAAVALREPSLGPVFGMKGGATGGGYAQVAPREEINLHFTGDIHAITAAHNLLAAAIDNRLAKEARWSTAYLAKALCPDDEYTPSMRKRLEKLGIDSAKPSDLSDEDKERMFRLNIDPDSIQWRRVVDTSDAALRNIVFPGSLPGSLSVSSSRFMRTT